MKSHKATAGTTKANQKVTTKAAPTPTTATTTIAVEKKERAPKAVKVVKEKVPSNISKGKQIFGEELVKRADGAFANNKAFRKSVLTRMTTELAVSMASAATMYNAAKTEATAENPEVGLGRDPKKEPAPKKVKIASVAPAAEVNAEAGAQKEEANA